ncbi:thiamine-phosphate kinase [Paenibacillus filicis]|uniref:Thiamine-monophosphate kinase n=1 Tax=Paenibacillus gyeongsangnamensis TaxID=3388067 RepID=A0ABT4QFP2_9BACL|nr:thiamine-phosphate kinase [Paenibacillus filicis]MCZ8515672.1 thiamine-phosphate kinase [Paenibacillus filicis]
MSSLDEFGLIRMLTEGKQPESLLRAGGVETGIGDDAAVAEATPGMRLVMTCDTMNEDIHFKRITMRDADIGFKAMASAVSDIAAMGGIPRYALISLSMPKGTEPERVRSIYDGLYESAARWNVMVVGGDTTSCTGGISLGVTVIGEVEPGRALLRSAARPGDAVFATGLLGRSSAGLDLLLNRAIPAGNWGSFDPQEEALVQAHCRPEPQVNAGRLLLESGMCRALNDISDGLASEAWEVAEASGVGIDLVEDRIPVADELYAYAARQGKDPMDYILYGGEDYQLVGTVPAGQALELQLRCKAAGVPLHIIGCVTGEAPGVRLVQSSGFLLNLGKRGYNHFAEEGG